MRRPGLAVLGQAGGQVGVVVLDADQLDVVALERVLGRQVLGMQVVGDDLRLDREQPLEVLDPLEEGAQRLVVLEVADVVADPRRLPLATQNVFFSSAPQASSGRGVPAPGSASAGGT